MLNKKGLTLIEIIIALAILGIISVSILTGFSSYFSMLSNTKTFTKDDFKAQQDIEQKIQTIKDEVLLGNTPTGQVDYKLFDGTIYQRTVKGYPREALIRNNRNIYTIVADSRMPKFGVATVSNVGIDLWVSNIMVPNSYTSTPVLGIRSRTLVMSDPHNVNLMNLYKWYVSKPGFNIPMLGNPEETEIGVKYPRFPNDYYVIPNETTKNLNAILLAYGDRHIVYTVTPASKSGKMGETIPSNPLFISGLPVINDLKLHLNASYINKEDLLQVRKIGINEIYTKKWMDLSTSKNDAIQNTNASQPQLIESIYNANQWGKNLNGNAGTSMTTTGNFPATNALSVVVVAKIKQNYGGSPHTPIIEGGGGSWGFGWTDSGALSYYRKNKSGNYDYAIKPKIPDFNWHIFTGIISGDSIKFRIDGNEVEVPISNPLSSIGAGNVKINWYSQLEIGEVLMYNRDVSGADLGQIEDYLVNKYKPTEVISIVSLDNINETIIRGQSFTMPAFVTANMSNGTTQNVLVNWEPNLIVDTSIPGIKNSVGTAVLDNTKTMILSVNVLSISTLMDKNDTIAQGNTYSMPSSIQATMSDGSTRSIFVNWSPATISTASSGTKTSTGTSILDNTKTMKLTVNVSPVYVNVSGVTLNKNTTTIKKGKNERLLAVVNPLNASDKNIDWSSSDYRIASVDSNGNVIGIAKGNARITVTTKDGSFEATCTVKVN